MTQQSGRAASPASGAVLGLFRHPDEVAQALDALRQAGFDGGAIQVLSSAPYPEGTFGEERVRHHLGIYPLVGAGLGALFGLVVSIGTQLAYPLAQGSMPLVAIPAVVNMVFETTMLGAVALTFLGALIEARLPDFTPAAYDPRISEGLLGVLVDAPGSQAGAAERTLRGVGAVDVVCGAHA